MLLGNLYRLGKLQSRRCLSTLYNMAKYNVVFVLGGPGAGKGTQCEHIVKVTCNGSRNSYGYRNCC